MKLMLFLLAIIGMFCHTAGNVCMPSRFNVKMESVKDQRILDVSANFQNHIVAIVTPRKRLVMNLQSRKMHTVFQDGRCAVRELSRLHQETLYQCVPGSATMVGQYSIGFSHNRLDIRIFEFVTSSRRNIRHAFIQNLPFFTEVFNAGRTQLQAMHISYNFSTEVNDSVFDLPSGCPERT